MNLISYIYIIHTPNLLGRVKIGISNAPKNRVRQIEGELEAAQGFGVLLIPIWFPMPFPRQAKKLEWAMHTVFSRLNASRFVPPHSGRTEWFFTLNVVTAFIAYALNYSVEAAPTCSAFFILFLPIGLDFIICLLALVLFEWALLGAAVWLVLMVLGGLLSSI